MGLKERIREAALEHGFDDAGFTTVEPFHLYIEEIQARPEMYKWVNREDFSTLRGARPSRKYPWARSMVVLIRNYHKRAFPEELLGRFGRCYLVDERKRPAEEQQRFKKFLEFLRSNGIRAIYDSEIPARMSAVRSGVATYGRNCFVFAARTMKGASWLEIIPLVLDAELDPDEPSFEVGCPDDCNGACLKACPTGALYEPLRMNPHRCIAYMSYYGPDLTPHEFRVPMGTWVYGCDRCQEVCIRNRRWMRSILPENSDLEERKDLFTLERLLEMSQRYYEEVVWPQFFYISRKRIDKWKVNAARALGNLRDEGAVPLLARHLRESPYENVRAMCAWALGRIGGSKARAELEKARGSATDLVRGEILHALRGMEGVTEGG